MSADRLMPRKLSEDTILSWSELLEKYAGQNVVTSPTTKHVLDIELRGVAAINSQTGEEVEFVIVDAR